MRARVTVTLKTEVLDPQGDAIKKGFESLGVTGVSSVRVGKIIELELAPGVSDPDAVVRAAADKLLANPVIEDFSVEWVKDSAVTEISGSTGTALR